MTAWIEPREQKSESVNCVKFAETYYAIRLKNFPQFQATDFSSHDNSGSHKTPLVAINRPETGWPNHGQAEAQVKLRGGPNRSMFQNARMTCG